MEDGSSTARVGSAGRVRAMVAFALLSALWLPPSPRNRGRWRPRACNRTPPAPLPISLEGERRDAKGSTCCRRARRALLVVFGHGYSYNIGRVARPHAPDRQGRWDAVGTMKLSRVEGLPKDSSGFERSRGWPVKAGRRPGRGRAYFDAARGPFERIILAGVSMGGNASGLAAAAHAQRIDGGPLFDYWVGIEGAYNLTAYQRRARSRRPPAILFAIGRCRTSRPKTGAPSRVSRAALTRRTVVNERPTSLIRTPKASTSCTASRMGLAVYNQAQELTNSLRGEWLTTDLYSSPSMRPATTPPRRRWRLRRRPDGNAGHGSDMVAAPHRARHRL